MALGIENLKKVLAAVLHIANKVDELTQDGFQLVPDSLALLPNLVDALSLIKNGRDAWLEFEELDVQERIEVVDFVKAEFDIEDDKLEEVVEVALDTIESVAILVDTIKLALKK